MLVVPQWAWGQTDSSNPQQIVCGTQALEFYQVDYLENGGTGTTGSTYVWSVSTPLATITNNLGPSGSSNRISIDWSAVLIGSYTVTVVEENGNGCSADPIVLNVEIIQPDPPIVECWETATFNNTTCQWDVVGDPFTVNVEAGPAICYEGIAVFNFTGGPTNGVVTFTVDGVQQTLVLDATGAEIYLVDPATADVILTLININNGGCIIDLTGTATVDVSPQIITSPISHD